MSRYERRKGADFERYRANWWKDLGFAEARRNLSQYQKTDGRDLGGTHPFVEQCKCGSRITVLGAYKEACGAAREMEIPITSIKYDQEKVLIVMGEEDFGRLVKLAKGIWPAEKEKG